MGLGISKWWRWELAAFVAVGIAILVAALHFSNAMASGEWEQVDAVVVRHGIRSDYDGNHPLITVRLPDGTEQQVSISSNQAVQCTPGGPIALMRQGITYRVALEGCLNKH